MPCPAPPRVPGLSNKIIPSDFTELLRCCSHSGPLPPPPPSWGHCFIQEECGACVPSSFFQLPPKVGAGEPLQSTDGFLCSHFQKFRELVWDVNHASGLEKVAESKPERFGAAQTWRLAWGPSWKLANAVPLGSAGGEPAHLSQKAGSSR